MLPLLLIALAGAAQPVAKASDFPCYERDVKPIIDSKCASCHNTGEENLLSYSLARSHSYGMLRDVMTGNMPIGDSLPAAQKAVFVAWHEHGAPRCPEAPPAKRGSKGAGHRKAGSGD